MEDTLIVIFIAEIDPDYVFQISSEVEKNFQKHLGIFTTKNPSRVAANKIYALQLLIN